MVEIIYQHPLEVEVLKFAYSVDVCCNLTGISASWDTSSISLTAVCDLFMRYVTRTSALEYEDFNSAKSRLIERAEKFGEILFKAHKIIAMLSQDFVFDGWTILIHGFSRVVLKLPPFTVHQLKSDEPLIYSNKPIRLRPQHAHPRFKPLCKS